MPAWITIDEVKEDLKWSATDISFDTTLQRIIDGVCRQIENACSRPLVASDRVETFDGDGTDTLFIGYPIVSITSVVNDETTVAAGNMTHDARIGLLELTDGTTFASGERTVTVTYRYGYEVSSFPADLKLAALLWASKLFIDIKDSRLGVSGTTHGDESISFVKGIPEDVRALIDPYRRAL